MNNDNKYDPSPQEIALKRTLPDDLVQHFQAAANHGRDLLALIDQAKALEATSMTTASISIPGHVAESQPSIRKKF